VEGSGQGQNRLARSADKKGSPRGKEGGKEKKRSPSAKEGEKEKKGSPRGKEVSHTRNG